MASTHRSERGGEWSAIDAVDGSSTGTGVPRTWLLLR
jgi:hypothetical protein